MRGWLLGTIDGTTSGIIPANYVKILGKKVVQTQGPSVPPTRSSITPPPRMPKINSENKPSYSMEQLFNQS